MMVAAVMVVASVPAQHSARGGLLYAAEGGHPCQAPAILAVAVQGSAVACASIQYKNCLRGGVGGGGLDHSRPCRLRTLLMPSCRACTWSQWAFENHPLQCQS